jgi:hypothetical protein
LSRKLDFPVFDADNHMYETTDAFTKYLPPGYSGLVKYVQVDGRTKIALKNKISDYIPNPTFSKVAPPGAQELEFKLKNPSSRTKRKEGDKAFRLRARAWIAASLTPLPDRADPESGDGRDEAAWLRARQLQARLYAGGFAGICYPREYGGLGLTPAHQRAFNEEAAGYEMSVLLNIPTFTICAPTILDMGSEDHKRAHLTAAIRGEEVFVQFLSEPASGSDLAGVSGRSTAAVSSARSSSTTSRSRFRRWSARSTAAGRWPRVSSSTSATRWAAGRRTSAVRRRAAAGSPRSRS